MLRDPMQPDKQLQYTQMTAGNGTSERRESELLYGKTAANHSFNVKVTSVTGKHNKFRECLLTFGEITD
jgi:hypothetical protein